MQEYKRKYPLFALCGLNCGLCPRYQTDSASRCPGCGGPGFHLKHPACAVITCNKKHDNVEFCFECSAYPCEKYAKESNIDSFISYANVKIDLQSAQENIKKYKQGLNEKVNILEHLIAHYNDGKRKNFYCIAVNLFKLDDLKKIMQHIAKEIDPQDMSMQDKIQLVITLFKEKAQHSRIALKLRK